MKSFALRKNRALIESLGEIVNVFLVQLSCGRCS